MKLIIKMLEIKHRDTTSYHSRTNDAVKRFNNVLNFILIKYLIKHLIKR